MANVSALGQFLSSEDLNQTGLFAKICHGNLNQTDQELITKILDANWNDEEQMVSNLLQYPMLIPEKIQIKCLIKALDDYDFPYYILSASVGVQKLKFIQSDLENIIDKLKSATLCEYSTVAMRAFISLQPYLKYPDDKDIFVKVLNVKKSPLHEASLSWLILNVEDKKELINILENNDVDKEIIEKAEVKMDSYCHSLAHGEPSKLSIELFDFVPNLNDFEALLTKEDTLSEFFDDLDKDRSQKLSPDQVKTFLEDIGEDVAMEEIIEEMGKIGIDENGRIDRDGFIEMMFPKFNMG